MRRVLYFILIFLLSQSVLASEGQLTITFFDVGIADAALIETPAGEHILIDGGTEEGGGKVANYLKSRRVKTIDIMIATHPHPDHVGGLAKILREFEVRSLYDTGMEYECEGFAAYREALKAFKGTTTTLFGRMILSLPSGVHLDFLNPKRQAKHIHTDCIVVRIRYGDIAALFTGDANDVTEGVLLFDEVPLKSDILKVSHHGASDATGEEFLKAVAPRYAVIPVTAPNKYGRPHQVVLDRLKSMGIAVYRTDECGDITFTTDGKSVGAPKCTRKLSKEHQ
ncbi:MAG: MBL fold metallo-hydrolase [Candidatus Coatesbacteria bacterium]|nr:MBL fold metallo-hydrolase [Candidatus Coatesbacteria bacterium]